MMNIIQSPHLFNNFLAPLYVEQFILFDLIQRDKEKKIFKKK